MIKKPFLKYQELMFFVGQAGVEMGKPLRFIGEFSSVTNTLILMGFTFTWLGLSITYIALMCIAAIIGWILTRTGVVAYNTRLVNQQNELLLDIHKRIKRLENKHK